jgi:hypothetical protein
MNQTDHLLGRSQFIISLVIAFGFLSAIGALFFFRKELSNEALAILGNLLATLGTVFALMANFWFARHRPNGGADPDDNGSTTVPTAPPAAAK